MRQSEQFSKTKKENPKDEEAKNAQLLIRAGYVQKQMAGVYAYLPLGLRVLNKFMSIIREEMNAIGGQEILMSALQEKDLWERTDRWDDSKNDAWFKTKLKNGKDVGLGITHEEPITKTLSTYVESYKDLPVYPYQFQLKFRNETRAKSGILRTREFIMKDLYSLSKDRKAHDKFYEKIKKAYFSIFKRTGLGDTTYLTFASGGIFSDFSHEFQTVCDAGEDTIYVDEKKNIAINQEVYNDAVLNTLALDKKNLKKKKAIEVGNIFTLGTRFSEPLNLTFIDEKGRSNFVFMGSYGIGPGRLMGTVVEIYADSKGIVWPTEVTPFQIHLLTLGDDASTIKRGEKLFKILEKNSISALYDDRKETPGVKMADSDLIGIPLRIIIGRKTDKNTYEIHTRNDGVKEIIPEKQLISYIQNYYAG